MMYLVIIFILLFFLAASVSVNLWLVKTLQDVNDESELEWGFEEDEE